MIKNHQRNRFDYDLIISQISNFIRLYVKKSKKKGIVIGLSGGLDSSVLVVLAVKALGHRGVKSLILPEKDLTPNRDISNAETLVTRLGIKSYQMEINPTKEIIEYRFPKNKIVSGNLSARIRKIILYHFAAHNDLLVASTSDKSEIMLGYFTKYGDGAGDIMPLGDLYKTDVRKLGKKLLLAESILKQPSSPRLWPGQTAEAELGLKYEEIDSILRLRKIGALDRCTLPRNKILKVCGRVEQSYHKRELPPICKLKMLKSNLTTY